MKLSNIEISEYKSIQSSNRFNIGDITCLVGKNEAGKTAILEALERLNPVIPEHSTFDVTDDYPRAEVTKYQQEVKAEKRTPATVVVATFTLCPEEISSVESELGTGILESPVLTLYKGYTNTLNVEICVNEQVAVKNMVEMAQLSTTLSKELVACFNLEELGTLAEAKNVAETDAENPSENGDGNEDTIKIQSIISLINIIRESKGLSDYIYNKHLKHLLPKFLYFDEYYLMKGHENIEALKDRVSQNKLSNTDYPLLGLIELAQLNLDELLNINRTEALQAQLEGASNHLSGKVLKYWSQNKHLSMKIDVRQARAGDPEGMTTGTNIWARIHDAKRMVSTLLGTRSRGFVWFFSFLAWFDQQQHKNEPLILLLDEPGLFLHGKAQGDLLRYIDEELQGNHQVIYTTHSPFMVDSTKFDRVRIVQDKSMDSDEVPSGEDGTKVITEVLEATQDSLFPLQGALGYDICQTLFVGPNSLVVEGVSDLLYIQTLSALLDAQGKKGLSEKWTITPVGGADKVPTFVALLGSQKGFKIATLIDLQKKDQQTIENLYKRKLLKKQNVLTFADFTGGIEADIEDMFDVEFYLNIVNEEYAKELDKPITKEMLTFKAHRILPKLENYFTANPQKSGINFNHYRPARYFTENISSLMTEIQKKTLDQFVAAFKALNGLL